MKKIFLYTICALLSTTFAVNGANQYNGAELYSKESVKYGRFDVRMRTISGSGTVASFFLYYDDSYLGSPEPWEEIDIEALGKDANVFQSNVITGNAASKVTSEKLHSFTNLATQYHTYTVEWTPDYIVWKFDGTEIRRTTGAQVTACQQQPMSYRFNLWISDVSSWVGAFNPSILPVYQFINWISYAKYTPGAGTNGTDFTPEWRDDFDTFDSKRWGKGDWTFEGNLVDFSPNNIVAKDGYCIICLTSTTAKGFSGEVPKDDETAIKRGQLDVNQNVFTINQNNQAQHFSVTLNGRLVPGIDKTPSALLFTKSNNRIRPQVIFSK